MSIINSKFILLATMVAGLLTCTEHSVFAGMGQGPKITGTYDLNVDSSPGLMTNCVFYGEEFVGPDVLTDKWYILQDGDSVRMLEILAEGTDDELRIQFEGQIHRDALGVRRVGFNLCNDPSTGVDGSMTGNWRLSKAQGDIIVEGVETWYGIFFDEKFTEPCSDLMRRSTKSIPDDIRAQLEQPCAD